MPLMSVNLSDLHIRKMLDTHLLKKGDAENMEKVAQVTSTNHWICQRKAGTSGTTGPKGSSKGN